MTDEEVLLTQVEQLAGQVPQVGDIFDNHMILYVHDSDINDSKKLAIDLETGEVKEITLKVDGANVNIMAETETHFLVTTGIEIIELDDTGLDGQPTKTPFQWDKLAIVSKKDYWNNDPNYKEISDTIFE